MQLRIDGREPGAEHGEAMEQPRREKPRPSTSDRRVAEATEGDGVEGEADQRV